MKNCLEEYINYKASGTAEKYIEGNPQIAKTALHLDEEDRGGEGIRGKKPRTVQ